MLIDAPLTLSNTIMHHKHLSHLMAKSMNELAHKSPLIFLCRVFKTARFTQADGLTSSHVNTPVRVNPPTRVNFLIVSRPFACNRVKLSPENIAFTGLAVPGSPRMSYLLPSS